MRSIFNHVFCGFMVLMDNESDIYDDLMYNLLIHNDLEMVDQYEMSEED